MKKSIEKMLTRSAARNLKANVTKEGSVISPKKKSNKNDSKDAASNSKSPKVKLNSSNSSKKKNDSKLERLCEINLNLNLEGPHREGSLNSPIIINLGNLLGNTDFSKLLNKSVSNLKVNARVNCGNTTTLTEESVSVKKKKAKKVNVSYKTFNPKVTSSSVKLKSPSKKKKTGVSPKGKRSESDQFSKSHNNSCGEEKTLKSVHDTSPSIKNEESSAGSANLNEHQGESTNETVSVILNKGSESRIRLTRLTDEEIASYTSNRTNEDDITTIEDSQEAENDPDLASPSMESTKSMSSNRGDENAIRKKNLLMELSFMDTWVAKHRERKGSLPPSEPENPVSDGVGSTEIECNGTPIQNEDAVPEKTDNVLNNRTERREASVPRTSLNSNHDSFTSNEKRSESSVIVSQDKEPRKSFRRQLLYGRASGSPEERNYEETSPKKSRETMQDESRNSGGELSVEKENISCISGVNAVSDETCNDKSVPKPSRNLSQSELDSDKQIDTQSTSTDNKRQENGCLTDNAIINSLLEDVKSFIGLTDDKPVAETLKSKGSEKKNIQKSSAREEKESGIGVDSLTACGSPGSSVPKKDSTRSRIRSMKDNQKELIESLLEDVKASIQLSPKNCLSSKKRSKKKSRSPKGVVEACSPKNSGSRKEEINRNDVIDSLLKEARSALGIDVLPDSKEQKKEVVESKKSQQKGLLHNMVTSIGISQPGGSEASGGEASDKADLMKETQKDTRREEEEERVSKELIDSILDIVKDSIGLTTDDAASPKKNRFESTKRPKKRKRKLKEEEPVICSELVKASEEKSTIECTKSDSSCVMNDSERLKMVGVGDLEDPESRKRKSEELHCFELGCVKKELKRRKTEVKTKGKPARKSKKAKKIDEEVVAQVEEEVNEGRLDVEEVKEKSNVVEDEGRVEESEAEEKDDAEDRTEVEVAEEEAKKEGNELELPEDFLASIPDKKPTVTKTEVRMKKKAEKTRRRKSRKRVSGDGYIPLNISGPTSFSVARLDKLQNMKLQHPAMSLKHDLIYGPRVDRVPYSAILAYEHKRKCRRMWR